MTSVRKRKMNRSSVRKNTRRLKDKQRDINVHSNPIIEANWDKSLTLQQNYKKLGLRSKLGHLAGGQEQKVETLTEIRARNKSQPGSASIDEIENTEDPTKIPEGEARLIRNDEGEVVRVIYGTMKAVIPEPKKDSAVVELLQQYGEKYSKLKKERVASDRENEWLKNLYEKHGDDYEKMMWDKKLNVNQQSAGDLRRRITKWKKLKGIV
jgi:nucleolar protein 16